MWTREAVEQHSVDLRQFIDFRPATLPDGQRIIEAHNSSGLTFSILPDRGLDIWGAAFNGLPLSWISQNAPHRADSGAGWLRNFNGGLMTTCGLTHVGPPEVDPVSGEQRGIHGRYTYQAARQIAIHGGWEGEDGDSRYVLTLTGTISQSALFGEQLRLERSYRLTLGSPTIAITDTITNAGDTPAPLMTLYHCNVGYPLVMAGTRLLVPAARAYARDTAAAAGLERRAEYDAPTDGYAEQVFFYHVKIGADGWTEAALLREDRGLSFIWDARAMPYLTQWKNTRTGIYVCGVEPGNCIPEGQNAARDSGRLTTLQPGERRRFARLITALGNAEAVAACRGRIAMLEGEGVPVPGCMLDDYARWG